VRQLGYAFEDEEGEIGFRCIGVPICDAANRAIAAISVAGTTSQISDDRVKKLAASLKTAALQISAQLGSNPGLETCDDSTAEQLTKTRNRFPA